MMEGGHQDLRAQPVLGVCHYLKQLTDMWGIQREWPSETVLAGVMGWRQVPDRLGQTAQSVCASGGEQQARLEGQVH